MDGESTERSPSPLVLAPLLASDCEEPAGDWNESKNESTEGN